MRKLMATISYDGTNFSGFQVQPNKRTIQGEIEKALSKIHKGSTVRIQGSGRTDAGVHAKGQTFQFVSPLKLSCTQWKKALNALCPGDVYIHNVQEVPNHFHVRFDAMQKEYRYFVWLTTERNVFRRNYYHCINGTLNLQDMKNACKYFIGEHDFTAFSSAKSTAKGSKVRTLKEVRCEQRGQEITFILRGDGFLYHMVRTIVGFLLEIGQGKRKATDIPHLFESRDRRKVGMTAPPQGLYLWEVVYPKLE